MENRPLVCRRCEPAVYFTHYDRLRAHLRAAHRILDLANSDLPLYETYPGGMHDMIRNAPRPQPQNRLPENYRQILSEEVRNAVRDAVSQTLPMLISTEMRNNIPNLVQQYLNEIPSLHKKDEQIPHDNVRERGSIRQLLSNLARNQPIATTSRNVDAEGKENDPPPASGNDSTSTENAQIAEKDTPKMVEAVEKGAEEVLAHQIVDPAALKTVEKALSKTIEEAGPSSVVDKEPSQPNVGTIEKPSQPNAGAEKLVQSSQQDVAGGTVQDSQQTVGVEEILAQLAQDDIQRDFVECDKAIEHSKSLLEAQANASDDSDVLIIDEPATAITVRPSQIMVETPFNMGVVVKNTNSDEELANYDSDDGIIRFPSAGTTSRTESLKFVARTSKRLGSRTKSPSRKRGAKK